MVLPSSRSISYTYRTSGGLHDEEASRVSTVVDDTGTSGGGGSVTIAQYDYLGTSALVRTRLNAIACFSRVYDGSNAIVDLDRFNRITTHRWTKDLATDQDLYQTVLSYDRASNITSIEDNVHTGFDAKYSLDGLQRLTQTEEGTLSSGSITSKTRDQQWTLSHTGNWDRAKLDLNGDGDFSDTSEHDDTRSHNAVNELTARDTDSNSSINFALTYDAAGNLSDDGEHYEYEYDAFYRLRKVKNTSTQALVAEYRYNALNHRIGVHEDSDTDGDVDSNDKWYYDAFDERWRMLARFRESDTAPKEDFVPHQAGDSGHGTSSYIDLVICRNRDADTAWTAASDGTLEERSYLLQNWRADVSAVVSGSGLLKEWVKYSSYGIPIGLPGGDTDSDGDCDASDITQVQTWITASAYDVRGDVDLDGDVDASDKSELQTNYQGITLGRGVLSSNAVASRKGYAGYEGLTNLAGSLWLARNRVLMAELGRWGRRDPLGYVNGATLFAYTGSSPASRLDPLGLDFTGAIGGGNVHNSTTQEIYVYGESDAWLFPDHLQGWLAPGQWSGDNGWGDADNVEVKCPIPCAVAWVTIPGGTNCTVKCDPCCTVICERHLIPFVPRTALVLYQ
jgi:hypothetical protein